MRFMYFAGALSALTALLALIIGWIVDINSVYIYICTIVFLLYLMVCLLIHFKKYEWTKYYITIFVPLWHSIASILIGGFFNQSAITLGIAVLAFVFFQKTKKLRNAIILFNLITHCLVLLFLYFSTPILGVHDAPLDEIGVFVMSFFWIIASLEIYQQHNANLVSELERKNRQLSQKTTELERFTYIASHDLKSPLRNIVSFLGLAQKNLQAKKYPSVNNQLEFVQKSAGQMYDLLDDILEITKSEHNSDLKRSMIDLNDILEATKRSLHQEIEENDAIIQSDNLPVYYCNASELGIIFQNLIQNGLKYNESNPKKIKISHELKDEFLYLHFIDNGIGIQIEYQQQIFEYFKRLHTQSEFSGTGLGLGLCNKIISKYNGEILLKSTPEKGSTFTLKMPYRKGFVA